MTLLVLLLCISCLLFTNKMLLDKSSNSKKEIERDIYNHDRSTTTITTATTTTAALKRKGDRNTKIRNIIMRE